MNNSQLQPTDDATAAPAQESPATERNVTRAALPAFDSDAPLTQDTTRAGDDAATMSDDDFALHHPRSLRRRLEDNAVSTGTPDRAGRQPSRIRSQPLREDLRETPRRVREPVPVTWEPEPKRGRWPAKPFVVALAVVAWIAALGLLLADPGQLRGAGLGPRALVVLAWMLAAALTFVPIQLRMAIPGIAWQGIIGWGLLGYLLAFVPAPTGWLLDLPDLPVYMLLFFAMFYAISAAVAPLMFLLGRHVYRLRIHRLDVGRARRQGYEAGALIVATLIMAGLRVLTPGTFGLLLLVIVLTEALLLSQVQPEG